MARPEERIQITSWKQLQERIQFILDRVNADPSLALAAAVNPLHALEELGFDIDPRVRPAIEQRLRFKPRVSARLRQLREDIQRHAGHPFDVDSPVELDLVLFDRLGIKRPAPAASAASAASRREGEPSQLELRPPVQRRADREPPATDPLEALRGAHPIVAPLLEYRKLEASAPRLAPRALFDQVRRGERRLNVLNVHARLKGKPP